MTPIDLSNSYNTQLNMAQEQKFLQWARANGKLKDLFDYDLRGAWAAGAIKEGHLPDIWKKPNHPTFSDESQYSTPETPGGSWREENGKWSFIPSIQNIKTFGEEGLRQYFQAVEPDSYLELPSPQE